ncbi:hypothetical protein O181_006511 [Austropuccinia psidii MF-1]|uniref:Integrase catalytic domain-containing protein n=1 Tax=Austropuccinia psidii MF-1 TaxID=1389203 RepID=A0A9Q3GGU2_9BASI|nr:hypothetical protein [Austropuccinia psidii MF-1]
MSYIHEIQNKIQRCSTYLHTDRGGEFYSANFQSEDDALGMVFEQDPAKSPQTNGIAKKSNQTLITKFQCLLAQSNVPIIFWDEAMKFSSRSLNWKSPFSTLSDLKSTIEPVLSLNKLILFGLNIFLYLGPEDYSDSGQFPDPQKGSLKEHIEGLPSITTNKPPSVHSSQVGAIPTSPSRNPIVTLTPTTPGPFSEPIKSTGIEHVDPPHEP